jgi:putative DNA primase/helicase
MKTGFIKSLLGGDAIRCEEKFRNPFDYVPFTTLIFTFNELPHVNDSSDGFARKIQPIHWSNRFYGSKANPEIDNLAFDSDERSGIFNKLIPVIKKLLDTRKLQYENTVQETKIIWLSRSDSFFKFKNEHVVIGSKHRIEVNRVRDYYKQVCEDEGMTPITDNQLFTKISEMLGGSKPIRTRMDGESLRQWVGFTLDCEIQGDQQTLS